MATFPSRSLKNFRKHLQRMLDTIHEIHESDKLVNILAEKLPAELLEEKQISKALNNVIKKYPDKYIQNLFMINTITLMEVYLKDRVIEELTSNETSVINLLQRLDNSKKITMEDVIDGPLKLAISIVDDIIFHNLPKAERVYLYALDVDIKKMADFKLLNTAVKIRHGFVHELGKIKGKEIEFNNNYLQLIINEVAKFIENIDFFIVNRRKKIKHPYYYSKNRKHYDDFDIQDSINYACKKHGGI